MLDVTFFLDLYLFSFFFTQVFYNNINYKNPNSPGFTWQMDFQMGIMKKQKISEGLVTRDPPQYRTPSQVKEASLSFKNSRVLALLGP
jgi:hypothetical protein